MRLISVSIVSLLLLSSCGEDVQKFDEDCERPEEYRDCYVEDEWGEGLVALSDFDDVVRLCETPCNRVRSLNIYSTGGYSDLRAFSHIEQVDDGLSIASPETKSLDGLSFRSGPEFRALSVQSTGITDIGTAFDGITSIGKTPTGRGSIDFSFNPNLKTFEGFRNLKICQVEGGITISNSPLEDVKGFEALERVSSINIYSNKKLKDISGFNRLEQAVRIDVLSSERFSRWSGFQNLETVEYLAFGNLPNLDMCFVEELEETFMPAKVLLEDVGGECDE